MIHKIGSLIPKIDSTVMIAWNAEVAGDVTLAKNCSVWFSATIRADIAPVIIGKSVNIQDNAVIHVDTNIPCIIEDNVTIGHAAVLHSCTVKSGTTIGMSATVLNGAVIGKNCMVAAGSLIPPNKEYEDGVMIMGSPAKVIRKLTLEEIEDMQKNNTTYAEHAASFSKDYIRLD